MSLCVFPLKHQAGQRKQPNLLMCLQCSETAMITCMTMITVWAHQSDLLGHWPAYVGDYGKCLVLT